MSDTKMKTYVTFGQAHVHKVHGKTFDKDSVAVINCSDKKTGRDKAFELFGDKFFTTYYEDAFGKDSLKYFPRGLINVGD